MRRRTRVRLSRLVVFMALVAAWTVMVAPGTALAKKKGPPNTETVRFFVTTDSLSDLVIDGVFVDLDGDGILESDGTGVAEGRADKSSVVVNRPSPAVRMDFLDLGLDAFGDPITPFTAGTIYSLDGSGSMGIHDLRKGAVFRYFFRAPGLDGTEVHYRLDGDAIIVPDTLGSSFPTGDPNGYTVLVDNLRVSQDTGKKGNAYEGSFPGATAIIYLDRQ